MVFDKVLEKVKNNTMFKSGLEVYSIAREVYNLVNSNNIEDVQKPLNSAEEIYVCAAQRITEQSEKKIKSRIDYKVVHQSAMACRKVKSVAVSAKKMIKKRYNRAKEFVLNKYRMAKDIACTGYSSCKRRFMASRFMTSKKMQKLKVQLYNSQNKVTTMASKLFTQVDNFVGFKDVMKYAKKVTNDTKNYGLTIKNKAIEGKNIIVDLTTNNIVSASRMAVYSYGFAKQMVQADAQAMKMAFDTNRTLMMAYLKNLELEMYYSPDQSIKLIETFKQYANGLLNKENSDAVTESSANILNGNMDRINEQMASAQA